MRVKSICVWERTKKVALMLKDSLYSHFYLLRITLSVINQRSSRTSFTMFFPFLWMSFVRLTDFLRISVHSVNSWPKNENSNYLLIPMLLFFSSKFILKFWGKNNSIWKNINVTFFRWTIPFRFDGKLWSSLVMCVTRQDGFRSVLVRRSSSKSIAPLMSDNSDVQKLRE